MLERFFLVGIDKDTPIDIREMVSFESDIITAAVNNIKTDLKAEEVVILSTCNRSEIYLIIDKDSEQDILNFFPKFFDINKDILKPYIFLKKGKRSGPLSLDNIFVFLIKSYFCINFNNCLKLKDYAVKGLTFTVSSINAA